ncbi:MAG: hypothetical protein DRJ64_08390 [Thermoprotei archaeon]|nr:MAG: hypothetical protein DRJ64_08390 [Thermoprotei archaeon]
MGSTGYYIIGIICIIISIFAFWPLFFVGIALIVYGYKKGKEQKKYLAYGYYPAQPPVTQPYSYGYPQPTPPPPPITPPRQTIPPYPLVCPNCGQRLSGRERYCPNCGTDLSSYRR